MKSLAAVVVLVAGLWLASKGWGVALVAALIVAAALGAKPKTRGRLMTGHAHGPYSPSVARHEAGHAAAARALGGRVVSATVYKGGGGFVDAKIPDGARPAVAFWLAGQYAAGTRRGAGRDEELIRQELRKVPSSQRGAVRRAAARDARRIVSAKSGRIRRDAKVLMERGRL